MQIVHYGNLSASTVLIQPVGDHDLEEMETELNEIRKQGKADFQLIAVKVDNWNRDLSPWEASAVFGREGFGDGAGELLQFLLGQCADRRKTYYMLKMQKIRTILEWNPGNHFKDAGIRTAKGFAWLIRNQGAE